MHSAFEVFYHGIFLATVSAFSLGPVFFTILETSINRGFWKAVGIAFGVMISDSLFILFAFLSVGQIINDARVTHAIGMIGGVLLILFGIYHLIREPPHPHVKIESRGFSFLFFMKGFFINSFNPFVLIFWLSAVSYFESDQEFNAPDRTMVFIIAIAGNFSFDVLKSFLAGRLKIFLNHARIIFLNRAVGIGLILFGLRLLWKVFAL